MPKITSPSQLNIGTEIVISQTAKTIQLVATGNLNAKDGVTLQAVYSKLIELWTTSTFQDMPFPMYAIDSISGQYYIGTTGITSNGWTWADNNTRQYIRDGGWNEYDMSGNLTRVYCCFRGLGSINSGAQPYYQLTAGGTATNFPYTDQPNQAIQVFGDASNGNFSNLTYAKCYVREYARTFTSSVLSDTGKTSNSNFINDFLLSNSVDLKIIENDTNVSTNAPYTGITVTYYGSDQTINIGGTDYTFRVIVDGNNATLEQIYTKIQYLLRQNSDIDSGAGTVIGRTASPLMAFTGNDLKTSQGVYISNIQAGDTGRITYTTQTNVEVTPPVAYGLNITGLVTGSSVRIFTSGTQTILSNTENSSTSFSWNNTGTPPTIDITVLKNDHAPIRITGITLVAGSTTTQQVEQQFDREYETSSGLTYTTDFSANTGTKRLTLTKSSTWRNFYSALKEAWKDQTNLRNVLFPVTPDGVTTYTLTNDWEFDNSTSISYLSRGGHRYLNNSNVELAVWSAFRSLGDTTGRIIKYQTADGSGTGTLQNVGPIDSLVQVYGDSTHGNFDARSWLVFKVIDDGYYDTEYDIISEQDITSLTDNLYTFPFVATSTSLPTGDPAITGVTITDHGNSPVTWDAGNGNKQYSITITDSGTNTAEDILQWIVYNKSLGGNFQGKDAFNWPQMVYGESGSYETKRGKVYGDVGASLKGVRVIRGVGTPHPGFTRFQADDGTYGLVPVVATASVTNIPNGCRLQVYNVTTDTEIYNDFVAATSWIQTYNDGTTCTSGDTIRVRVAFYNGLTANQKFQSTTIASTAGWSIDYTATACAVYATYGIDGSTVTEFSFDGVNLHVDVNDPDNLWYVSRLFAWDKYQTWNTVQGIRDFFLAITAVDAGNIKLTGVFLDNISTNTAKQADAVRIFRDDDALPVINPTSGGGGLTFFSTGTIYIAETGTSGLTPTEAATLAKLNTLTEDVSGLRFTAKALEEASSQTEISDKLRKIENTTNTILSLTA